MAMIQLESIKESGWRLRNSNSRGNPDLGLTFGINGGVPIAGYRGDSGALMMFASLPDNLSLLSQPTATATMIPTTELAEVIPTTEVAAESTAEVIPTTAVAAESTATPTLSPTCTGTPMPTLTILPTATGTPIPTLTPTQEPPIIPDNISGT
jgi:hypothetical protein